MILGSDGKVARHRWCARARAGGPTVKYSLNEVGLPPLHSASDDDNDNGDTTTQAGRPAGRQAGLTVVPRNSDAVLLARQSPSLGYQLSSGSFLPGAPEPGKRVIGLVLVC